LKSEEGIIYYDAMDLVNLFVREMGQEKWDGRGERNMIGSVRETEWVSDEVVQFIDDAG
jgi:hypothetical protein